MKQSGVNVRRTLKIQLNTVGASQCSNVFGPPCQLSRILVCGIISSICEYATSSIESWARNGACAISVCSCFGEVEDGLNNY